MIINTKKYIENFIKIRDKEANIIPFVLNEPQNKLYNKIKEMRAAGKPVRIIILKARQMGFSTLTEAIIFKNTATKENIHSGIIAHKEEATTNLFNMSKRMYDLLPDELKPEIRSSNAKELVFDNKDGTGLRSKIKCMTAGGEGIGRSDTFNNLHISELAFWKGEKKDILTGLFQAVPNTEDSMIIIESTANGYEYFKELWDRAVAGLSDYVPLFIGWNELSSYRMPYNGFELLDKEKDLMDLYKLDLDQITWRRWCIQNNLSGNEEDFKQEYPISPEEAFISTGKSVFNKEQVLEKINRSKEPLLEGHFVYDYDGTRVSNIRFRQEENGYVKIYKKPSKDDYYVIGGDTSGEGSDNFTAQVLDNTSGEQCAVLKHQFDEDLYTKQIYCLGTYYNNALIGIEANFSSFPIRELSRIGYDNQFVREQEDSFSSNIIKSFGFKTTSITRPVILSELVEIVRENIGLIKDKDTLKEMLTFIRNERGRAQADTGAHDDLIMALAIAYYIRPQQKMCKRVEIKKEPIYNFASERPDYGTEYDKLKII